MKQALKQAEIAYDEREIPVGAVVVCQQSIVSKAYNQVERLNDSTAHAEMLALTSAFNHFGAKYLPECTLYVTLEPCVMCAGALAWSQIGKVVYGADDPRRGFTNHGGKELLHARTKLKKGILSEQCASMITRFFNELREK